MIYSLLGEFSGVCSQEWRASLGIIRKSEGILRLRIRDKVLRSGVKRLVLLILNLDVGQIHWYRLSDLNGVLSVSVMASEEELKSEIERLRAENEALKKPSRGRVYLKVSEKGGLSVYGLGRFPVTLYQEQWEKLLDMADEIRDFIRENGHSLKKKDSSV